MIGSLIVFTMSAAGCPVSPAVDPPGKPTEILVRRAVADAREEVRNAVITGALRAERKADWNRVPKIVWRAGPWWEARSTIGPTCASGKTDWPRGTIFLAVTPAKDIPAVARFEAENFWLCEIGRADMAAVHEHRGIWQRDKP